MAAAELNVLRTKGIAEEALTGGEFVKRGAAADGIVMADTQGEEVIGTVQHDAAIGDSVTVIALGAVQMIAGGVVTVQGNITTGADGRVEDAATGDVIAGRALEGASGDGIKIFVFLNPQLTATVVPA